VGAVCYCDVGNAFLYTVQINIMLRRSTSGRLLTVQCTCVIILQCIKTPGIEKSNVNVNFYFQNYKDHSDFDIYLSVHRNIITNYSQQDATFLEFIYFYRRSTCFRRFLRPSSGAHNCTYSFRYCQPILLPAATVAEMKLT
jgi:hypothetical protein